MKNPFISIGTWNRRYREMMEAVHTPEGRNQVIEALEHISLNKDLSFGERKLLDLAKNYEARMKEQAEKVIELNSFRKIKL